MALVQEYLKLTEKYICEYGDNTILLMLVGVFYEVYGLKDELGNYSGSRIVDFSQICELQIAEKKVCISHSNNSSLVVVMAGFKDMLLEKYLRKLQDAGFTAVVYKQDEKDKKITRSLEGIYSPGTFFSQDSLKLTNNIACIWVDVVNYKREKMVVVGMSNIDVYTGKSNIFEYQDKYILNPTTFDELERFISIHEPSECIFISNVPEAEDSIIQFANIKSSLLHKINAKNTITTTTTSSVQKDSSSEKEKRVKNCQKQTYQMEILKRFYKDIDNKEGIVDTFFQNAIASQSFCFLLDFIYQHNPYLVHKIHEPCFENCSDRLILANHSLKQLNMIADTSSDERNTTSVMKILNKCLTPMGKRMFTHQCLNPTTNHVYLQTEYDIVEKVLENNFQTNYVFFSQRGREIKDLSKLERQIILKKMPPKSFCILNNNLQLIMEMIEFVETQCDYLLEYLQKKGLDISLLKQFGKDMKEYIETHMSLEVAKNIDNVQTFDTNFFNSGIHSELDRTTKVIEESEEKLETIKDYLSNIIKSKENKSSNVNTTKSNDYVKIHETEKNSYNLVTTMRRCKLLEDALPKKGIVYPGNSESLKGFSYFVEKDNFYFTKQNATNNYIHEPQLNDICKTITNSKNSIKYILTFVYNHFVETFGEKFQASLEKLVAFVTYMDIVYCKAIVSKKNNYCKPVLQLDAEKSFVNAKDLRHCLIEHLQHNEFYVTNDISLGYNKDYNEKTKTNENVKSKSNEGTDGILLYGTNAVGKTSLIKALGISVIMAQAGLYVPCSQFVFKPYKYIFTRILGNDNIFKGLSTFAVEMSELRTILRLADENSLILGDELCSGTEIVSAISIFVAGICKLHAQKSSYMFATHLHEITKYEEITNMKNLKLKHMEVVYDKEKDVLVYHRKLKDGPGNSLYGLEVCKSLSLPNDFLEMANDIRMKYNPDTGSSILSLKTSHYNSKKIVGLCEKCGINMSKEVHHLTHQSQSDADGYILVHGYKVHKNRLANLMSLCESCHDDFHRINENKKQIKLKTSNLNYMH